MVKRRELLERKHVTFELKPSAGAVPPHDLDAEAGVLSACMLATPGPDGLRSSTAYLDCHDLLRPEMFYSGAHLRIWEAIEQLTELGTPVDVLTVSQHLKDRQRLTEAGGMPYLAQILDSAPVIANVRNYAQKVHDKWKLRQLILKASRIASQAFGDVGDVGDYIRNAAKQVDDLSQSAEQDRLIEARPLLRAVYSNIKSAYEEGRPPGISSGFRAYDAITHGFHRTDLTIVAARPGMGKTALMIAFMLAIAGQEPMILTDDGKPWADQAVGFFSLEMPREQIGKRMVGIDSGVKASHIRSGRLEDHEWTPLTQSAHRLADLPIYVDDTPALTLAAMRAKIRRMKAKCETSTREGRPRRLAAIFTDYLQLMKDHEARTRIEEIGAISRGLKQIAKEEDVAVIAGCQLNRAVETRTGSKRPVMSDLRESGDIENDADNIVFIYRGNYYGEEDPEGEEGRTELIIGKQRNGPTNTAIVRYTPECTRFDTMPGY